LVGAARHDGIGDHPGKAIKGWKRAWKNQLIEQSNPKWIDLYTDIIGH
jgi:predicted GIY-YIG superfamily endonuclease